MLYVTVGLAVLFGLVTILGLGAIDQAAQLVFNERLATAHTTAGILERDFERVATKIDEAERELAGSTGTAAALLDRLDRSAPFLFFRISGVWLIDGQGRPRDAAGLPRPPATSGSQLPLGPFDGRYTVLRAMGPVAGSVSFAAIAVRLPGSAGAVGSVVVVHTVSLNSTADYVPAIHGQPGSDASSASGATDATEKYHLEVVDPSGTAVLGIGADERPGQPSRHYAAIAGLVAEHRAAALLHQPEPGAGFDPHVMAVVPVTSSPFYIVLEQPVDVALALPFQLRERLILLAVLGFVVALVLAWVTTRHVVKPTEELTLAAERMALGDLASPIDVAAQDEIGQLAESLEAMRLRLKEAHEAIERTNSELEARVAERTARLEQLLRRTISAQEEERHRLARELHDETAQTLAALAIAIDRARDALDGSGTQAAEQIRAAREIAGRLLAETRRLILGLRPAVLDDLGLIPAIRWQCETSLAERGVETTFEADPPDARLPSHLEVTLFRIVQEAVSNIARHAEARHARVRLTFRDGVATAVITDDGKGFDVGRLSRSGDRDASVGLLGMQERVSLLNGQMEIRSAQGSGTEIVVQVPIAEEAAR